MAKLKHAIGKKSFVLSLDMFIAVIITILVMTAAQRNISKAEENSISNAQMISAGSDIAALLDHREVLQTLDENNIESRMNDLLPQNYDMSLKIVVDDGTVLYVSNSTPETQLSAAGKRFFTIKDGNSIKNNAYVIYQIWTR
ncbi:MAG: hypothetical protein NT001_02955 [Candidatus Woesearchaeota archaeon]|nr:hypothetical protein [Candidatus Woesearchaeota archaeon]